MGADEPTSKVTAWLLRNGERIAPLEIADTFESRRRGLLGRNGIDGALLLRHTASVHTFRMRFPIDVAFLDRDLRVLSVLMMVPNRPGLPRLRARSVLEAEAGAFALWGLRAGDQLAIGRPSAALP